MEQIQALKKLHSLQRLACLCITIAKGSIFTWYNYHLVVIGQERLRGYRFNCTEGGCLWHICIEKQPREEKAGRREGTPNLGMVTDFISLKDYVDYEVKTKIVRGDRNHSTDNHLRKHIL